MRTTTDALHRLRSPAARRRAGGGFTLLELILVAAISSVLFLLLIRWILTLGATSSTSMENAAAQRSADIARDAFAADADRARPCAPGEPSALRSITPDQVTFTTTDDGGSIRFVSWSIAGPTSSGAFHLVRSERPGGADPCTPAGASTRTTYHEHVEAIQTDRIRSGDTSRRPGFYAITGGQAVTSPEQAWGDCGSHQDADRCYASGVGLNWLLTSPVDSGSPIAVARSFTFATTAEGLS